MSHHAQKERTNDGIGKDENAVSTDEVDYPFFIHRGDLLAWGGTKIKYQRVIRDVPGKAS